MEDKVVSLEVSKLAKEKGFTSLDMTNTDVIIKAYYMSDLVTLHISRAYIQREEIRRNLLIYEAPTQSLLQKWLREVHNISVHSQPFIASRLYNNEKPFYILDESYSYFLFRDGEYINDRANLLGFEEALEIGLLEALKLV